MKFGFQPQTRVVEMRFLSPVLMIICLASLNARAMEATKKGDAHKTDACIDACIATQRSCVIAAATQMR